MSSKGKKYDQGKPPLVRGCFYYFSKALNAVAEVSGYGAKKYEVPLEDKNFARVDDGVNRYTDALGRHLAAEGYERLDPESGLLHAAHAAWNALARLEMMLEQARPVEKPAPAPEVDTELDRIRRVDWKPKQGEPNTGWDPVRSLVMKGTK